jgi:hypothetical protein
VWSSFTWFKCWLLWTRQWSLWSTEDRDFLTNCFWRREVFHGVGHGKWKRSGGNGHGSSEQRFVLRCGKGRWGCNDYCVVTTTVLQRLLCCNDYCVVTTTVLWRLLCCDAAILSHNRNTNCTTLLQTPVLIPRSVVSLLPLLKEKSMRMKCLSARPLSTL